jgi:vacuolar-type H+-ATPase subunit F/Vma7
MARLTMVAPTELAVGFRLAGTDVVAVDTPEDTEAALERLRNDAEVGVIGVYAPFFDRLEPAIRRTYEDSVAPVVIAVPLGGTGTEAWDHRARLASLLQRAIGYRISFGESEET